MKKIVLILAITYSLFASGIDWPHDYKQALVEAKKSNKLVYVLLTSDNCRWCRRFENTTLQEKAIQERLAQEFIVVHISRDRDFVPKNFETTPVPRHYFVNSDGEIVYESLGHRGVECFEAFMDGAQDEIKVNK
ncbi:thioredoxin family protein [Sulfurimonas microaerophilic]|uniref:thioredoxin family protein n=1 Tax=Sulfurimonas microaerophilic TaxID=3058392 RepID=UPI002714C6D0|nr:thioredoxin family protein [Sulfurimonas sp. hsl 1-7]